CCTTGSSTPTEHQHQQQARIDQSCTLDHYYDTNNISTIITTQPNTVAHVATAAS
ncbi:hypothetical protein EDD11_006188, partial [Mortierella claussenii]